MRDLVNGFDNSRLMEHLNVSRETLERFSIYLRLLEHWQEKTNIVGASTIELFWKRHIADSLQCVQIFPDKVRWTDIGTGGGFPGLVIAIALADKCQSDVCLVDSSQKKCAFLRSVIRETGIFARVFPMRIEQYIQYNNEPEVVTARALATLDQLLTLCKPWLSGKTIGLFHKGRDYRQELRDTDSRWEFDLVKHKSKCSIGSVVLELRNLKPRSP